MDGESSAPPPRKVRFAPKVPTRKPKPILQPKPEVKEEIDASQTMELLRRVTESSGRPKVEKKSAPAQVAFGQGNASSYIKSFGPLKNKNKASGSQDGESASVKTEKIYNEPWNYYTYYPITLPIRRPYSGNPVLLDAVEFGEASETYEEDYVNSAETLGLLDESGKERMLFFQLPASLPLKKSATAEVDEGSKPVGRREKGCSLKDLPHGFMGKMLVYKSGAVKLKLGDTLYDVSPGSDCIFAQDVMAVNMEEKHCCVVGELGKRAMVTPDVDTLLKGVEGMP